MTDISQRLDEIQARADAATPNWDLDEHFRGDGFVVMADGVRRAHFPDLRNALGSEDNQAANAAFAVAARTDVPALVAALRAVLDLIAEEEAAASQSVARVFGGQPFPATVDVFDLRNAITTALGGDPR